MNFDAIEHICTMTRRAKRIRVRRSYFGECSIKISYGPMGMMTKTYRVDFLSLDAIRNRLRLRRVVERVTAKLQPRQPQMALAA